MLAQALNLVTQAANAEKMAMDTAVAALGEPHGRTVVELARMSVAGETLETLSAIAAAVSTMIGNGVSEGSPAVVSPSLNDSVRARRDPPPITDASGRVEMFGIPVPAGRLSEAEEVVATARTAVAQNRKANPYDHYRGKNSWCKSLFLAAFSTISADVAIPAPPDTILEAVAPVPAPEQQTRPSVLAAGPVRGSRPLHAAAPVRPADETIPDTPSAYPRVQPQQGQRLHAHGATAQTISEEVLPQSSVPSTPRSPGRSTFFKRTR